MKTSIAVVVGTSVLLLAVGAFGPSVQEATLKLPDGANDEGEAWKKWLIGLGRSRLARKIPTAVLERRGGLAGRPGSLEFVLGLKLALAVGTAALLVPAAALNPAAILAAGVAAMAAFRLPDIALARRAKARVTVISDQVSDLADVLLVMTQAGVSPALAFRRAAEVLPDPLGSEVGDVIRRLELGVPWRSALTEVADRTDVKPFKRLVRALTRSQRLGTSLASVLRTIADDLRHERRARAEQAARQAPVKMLFPLVFLILPAFLLLTVGPVVLSTIRSLS